MKLTSKFTPGALKSANNVLIKQGSVNTRCGALQLIDATIEHAVAWLDFMIYESNNKLNLYDGTSYLLMDTFGKLSGCTFSAFTTNGERQNRFYFLNKGGVLNYSSLPLAQLSEVVTVSNSLKDEIDVSYPIPDAVDICTWRDRIWLADGHSRVYHSGYQKQHEFDPLDSLEFQTGFGDNTTCIRPDGDRLLVGTQHSIWQVTGTSRNNWQRDQISGDGIGIVGPNAIANDGSRTFHVSRQGGFLLGNEKPLSEEVADFFTTPDENAQIELDPTGEFLYVLIHGSLLVFNIWYGGWSLLDLEVKGLLRTTSQLGFYGDSGLWVFTREGQPDIDILGHDQPIDWNVESWPETPNSRGRSRLDDIAIQAASAQDTDIVYTAIIDKQLDESHTFNVFPKLTQNGTQLDTWSGLIEKRRQDPVSVNLPIYEAGHSFSHLLSGQVFTIKIGRASCRERV